MEDKNKKLQNKVKRALASALESGAIGIQQLYTALFMLSACRTYDDQVEALRVLSYESPDLNKVFVEARAMSIAI